MSKEVGAGGRFDIFLDSGTYAHLSLLEFLFLIYLCIYSFGLEYRSLEPTSLIYIER